MLAPRTMRRNDSTVTSRAEGHQANLDRNYLLFWRFNSLTIFSIGIYFVATAVIMLWGSKFGKLRERDRLLDAIRWRGDEHVLNVGCGHGLVLIGAAERLGTGKAVGVDLWQKEDQAGNSPMATLANAKPEGVADRVEIKDGDARQFAVPRFYLRRRALKLGPT